MDDVYTDVQYAIDREITTQLMRITNGDIRGLSDAVMAGAMQLMGTTRKITGNIIKWLEEREKAHDRVFIAEAPFIMQRVFDKLEEEDRTFDFGDKAAIITGGGLEAPRHRGDTPQRVQRQSRESAWSPPREQHRPLHYGRKQLARTTMPRRTLPPPSTYPRSTQWY